MNSSSFSIAFIGLGKMGLPMARHLAAAGHTVTGFDRAAEPMALAAQSGLATAPALPALLAAETVFISSIPNDAALGELVVEVCRYARPGSVYIDTSTVSPQASAEAAAALGGRGIAYLRCTVSGNAPMAEAAQLTSLVSGDAVVYERLAQLFRCWGPTTFYLGEAEQARLMKLVLNLMIMLTTGMLAEGLALGRKGGLAWEDMWSVISASAVASPIVKAKAGALRARDFTPTFTVDQMKKDVGLILGAGQQLKVPLALTALSAQWLTSAAARGDALEDYATVIKVIEAAAALDTSGNN
jgi:3-hydroxyisobutyrate dehydrogenase